MDTELQCTDPWYQELEKKYGYDFCVLAGYFHEFKPFKYNYKDHFKLPIGKRVIQISGAFHPFHDGHDFMIKKAIRRLSMGGFRPHDEFAIVIHSDHADYYNTKGQYPKEERKRILQEYIDVNNGINGIEYYWVDEDNWEDSCSRNFTRLYSELSKQNVQTHFLCGGDRANYSLTFVDAGASIVVGRTNDKKFWLYDKFFSNTMVYNNDTHCFCAEDHPASSTEIRKQYNKT